MIEGKYDIIMKTPMGAKKGTVNGDSCMFSGELKTAMGKIAYIVEGNVVGDMLTGISKTKKGDFKITGKKII